VSILSAQGGIAIFRRLSDDTFRRLLIVLTFFSGAVLMIRELV
jgi:uncharacterized membrane protein YfcA